MNLYTASGGLNNAKVYFSVTHTFEEVFELDFRLVQYPEFYEEAFETFHKVRFHTHKHDIVMKWKRYLH